ncbi:MAG: hypothetical protein QOH57_3594 [Mycobacterium sp.]|nr:hypothetical protein [Mycobacterium sp.]
MSALRPTAAVLFAAAAVSLSVTTAASAAAVPQCINTGPTTTQCQTNGSTQINTSPSVTSNNNPFGWPGWGGGLVISLGGLGR